MPPAQGSGQCDFIFSVNPTDVDLERLDGKILVDYNDSDGDATLVRASTRESVTIRIYDSTTIPVKISVFVEGYKTAILQLVLSCDSIAGGVVDFIVPTIMVKGAIAVDANNQLVELQGKDGGSGSMVSLISNFKRN